MRGAKHADAGTVGEQSPFGRRLVNPLCEQAQHDGTVCGKPGSKFAAHFDAVRAGTARADHGQNGNLIHRGERSPDEENRRRIKKLTKAVGVGRIGNRQNRQVLGAAARKRAVNVRQVAQFQLGCLARRDAGASGKATRFREKRRLGIAEELYHAGTCPGADIQLGKPDPITVGLHFSLPVLSFLPLRGRAAFSSHQAYCAAPTPNTLRCSSLPVKTRFAGLFIRDAGDAFPIMIRGRRGCMRGRNHLLPRNGTEFPGSALLFIGAASPT